MKKLFVLFFVFPCVTLAATSANLLMKGYVSPQMSLKLKSTPVGENLIIAQGTVKSNSPSGFKLQVTSKNEGRLRLTFNKTDKLSISYREHPRHIDQDTIKFTILAQ